MPNESSEMIIFGSERFFTDVYDKFCSETNIAELIKNPENLSAQRMHIILNVPHQNREIHRINCVSRGWKHLNAWLALKTADLQRPDNNLFLSIRVGDVIIVEDEQDRDVVITHSPKVDLVGDYRLRKIWDSMAGYFLPLFDKQTIIDCIRIRLEENLQETSALAEKTADELEWY